MMPQDFDQLNKLVGFKRSMPIDRYFDGMVISPEQRERRKDLAESFEEGFLDLLIWAFYARQMRPLNLGEIELKVREVFERSIPGEVRRNDRTEQAVDILAEDIAQTTVAHSEEPFYFSEDRARLLAEDNANNFWNGTEYDIEVNRGRKWKTWNTILDGRERETHHLADGQMQEIMLPFEVGDSLMMFPKDASLGADPKEIINCRCSLTFE